MNKSWKTTVAGVIALIITLATAAKTYLETGTIDLPTLILGIAAGVGLIKAKDADVTGLPKVVPLALLCCVLLPSCAGLQNTTTTDTTMPDGTKIHAVATGPNAELIGTAIRSGMEAVTTVAVAKIHADK